MKKLAIIGSGDLGQLIAYHAIADNHFEIAGYFDDFKTAGTRVGEHLILGNIEQVDRGFQNNTFDVLLVAIGYKHFEQRENVFSAFKEKIPFATLIHRSCYIDPSCTVGAGSVLLPGCVFDYNVRIGENVLVNTGCCLAHDSSVDDHSFLSPSVAIAGFCKIGKCCNIGINSTVIDNIMISNNIQTGGGTVVINDLSEKGLYVGNPARFIR